MTNIKKSPGQSLIQSANLFPVVGIGASAGGLDAFKKLLRAVPENSGMAYVLVQHLDPNHESILPELLQKVTVIPVLEITDDMKVLPDHIYIIPSNKMLVANDGTLQLSPRTGRVNLPIDLFFASLAEVHQANAIGIVLSGAASDGTSGLKAIKDSGGITFAQEEASAAYDSMPRSAIQAGVVDFILPPEKIPEKLLEIKEQICLTDEELESFPKKEEDIYKQILSLVRIRKGNDFAFYKQTTIRRRILRRMAFSKNYEPDAYLTYLRENKSEQDALYQDFLIPVTAFFRDSKVFDHLCESVFPHILKNKAAGQPVRVWVSGCSTGEEAYSIAICLQEFLGESHGKAQVFATDISESAIAKARTGNYTNNEVKGVAPLRLQEFFTKTTTGYQVNKQIREMCVFAVHNFLKDPPFGNIDFVSCRNVLIYMEPFLQKKAMTTFHYALNPKGFLLLGKSETNGSTANLFAWANKTDKLFTPKDCPSRFMHVASPVKEKNLQDQNVSPETENTKTDFRKAADEIMLSKYTPTSVIINEAMDIVQFRGKTGTYLEQASGKPSHNLLKMAKTGLAFELRNLVSKAKKGNVAIAKENIPIQVNGVQQHISIVAIPLPNMADPHYLILFHDQTLAQDEETEAPQTQMPKTEKDKKNSYIRQLEEELAQIREDMRSITEDQEAANEELQSANEELLSGSEELQSLNEELETSKEELQSTNEELNVVNQEITGLNEQVTDARDYAEAIIGTIREPLVVLDKNLRVKSANNAFYKMFGANELETEGALIYNIGNNQWNVPALQVLFREILPNKTKFINFEITFNLPNIGQRHMLLNAREMVREKGEEKLILLAIEDITERLLIQEKINEIQQKHSEELELKVENRTFELSEANNELAFQNHEKESRAIELVVANKALVFENSEKEHRAAELIIANEELFFQNVEKGKRAAELIIANKELLFQNSEKEKRAAELIFANNELESFTYISSHDLQEPLRKIQIFASRLLETEYAALSDTGKDYLNVMLASAKRMRALIQDLLTYSHTNVTERKFEKIPLMDIVAEIRLELEEMLDEKQAVFEAGALCEVDINVSQFKQVIHNLITNALKFARAGIPPHIRIESAIVDGSELQKKSAVPGAHFQDKPYCHITFSDNGIGFDPQYKNKIFEVFQRLHFKEDYAGTGIGLAIVKKIVENHHGMITASGELNGGATFNIYLPVLV